MGWDKEKQNSVRYETDGDTGEVKSVTPVWVKESKETIDGKEVISDVIVGKPGESLHDHTYNLDNENTGKVDRVKW
jgi:hypothetical protein